MALFNQATDLQTRQTIWIMTNVVKGRPQLNSHRSDAMSSAGIDGYSAAELAGMYTTYQGN